VLARIRLLERESQNGSPEQPIFSLPASRPDKVRSKPSRPESRILADVATKEISM
jgi:hypothetical protein